MHWLYAKRDSNACLWRNEYVIQVNATVHHGDTNKNRYNMFKAWYKILLSTDNTLVLKHTDSHNKNQLEGVASFLLDYDECLECFDVIGVHKNKLHWVVQATGLGNYESMREALSKWNTNWNSGKRSN